MCDFAELVSPPVTTRSSAGCLTFWYHVFGAGHGSLSVWDQNNNMLWAKSLDMDNVWRQAKIPIQNNSPYIFTIRVTKGGNYTWMSTGIDNIFYHDGTNACSKTTLLPDKDTCGHMWRKSSLMKVIQRPSNPGKLLCIF